MLIAVTGMILCSWMLLATPLATGTVDGNPTTVPTPNPTTSSIPNPNETAVDEVAVRENEPRIAELYPNPATYQDVGEYVVVDFPEPTLTANWTLTDGHTEASLPNETVSGRVAFSTDPAVARLLTNETVYPLSGHLALADAGDTLELRRDGVLVDRTEYGRASRADRWLLTDGGWTWRPLGANDRLASHHPTPTAATAFVLPDAPEVATGAIEDADERVWLAGYTLSSPAVVEALRAANARGVEVRVLVDGTPVGGQTDHEAAALDALSDAGIEVRVFDGDRQRYRFHHPKYAIVDDRALVLTENWNPSGVEGRSSRGWGVLVESDEVADELATVFETDAGWRDTISWDAYRQDATVVEGRDADGVYPASFQPERVPVESVTVVTAPENAETEMRALLAGAEESIDLKQIRIADVDFPLLEETVKAAERGVTVRILLDRSWYVEEENRELARELDRLVDREDVSIEVRLVEPRSRFEKVHAKGVIVDERRVLVGSPNWNNNSLRNNREVALVLTGEEVGGYYAAVFEADWQGGRWHLPIGIAIAVVLATGGAALLGRRWIHFDRFEWVTVPEPSAYDGDEATEIGWMVERAGVSEIGEQIDRDGVRGAVEDAIGNSTSESEDDTHQQNGQHNRSEVAGRDRT